MSRRIASLCGVPVLLLAPEGPSADPLNLNPFSGDQCHIAGVAITHTGHPEPGLYFQVFGNDDRRV